MNFLARVSISSRTISSWSVQRSLLSLNHRLLSKDTQLGRPFKDVLSQLATVNAGANSTAGDRAMGKKYLSELANILREHPDHTLVQDGPSAVVIARALAVCDPEGSFKSLLEGLEVAFWSPSLATSVTDAEILDVCRSLQSLDTTAVGCVMIAMLWPMIRLIPGLNAEQLSFLAHSVSSFGIHHHGFSAAILKRTADITSSINLEQLCQIVLALDQADGKTLLKPFFTLVENSIHTAGAKIVANCFCVYQLLCSNDSSNALDGVSACFEKLNKRMAEVVLTASLDELTDLIHRASMNQTKPQFTTALQQALPRILHFKNNYLPEHVTLLLTSLSRHEVVHEDILAAVAERSCRIVALFQPEQMATVLRIFSSFELFDPELYPLMAIRVQHMTRQKIVIDAEHVTEMLTAFAKMSEKNEALLFSSIAQLKVGLPTISPEVAGKALAAYRKLNFNHQDIVAALESRLTSIPAPQ